jgi:hypothetical protein
VDPLEANDRELARRTAPAQKLAEALETMRAGIRLKRANIRRRFPAADEAEIDRLLAEWLTQDG